MKSKLIGAGVTVAVLAAASYWYWSPLLAMQQLRSAAIAGDADTFNDYVDYPRLRDSLKGQLTAVFTERIASRQAPNSDADKAGAALGAMLGLTMVDKVVDAFVRPETVMQAMQEGKMAPKPPAASASEADSPVRSDSEISWRSERKGFDQFIAYVFRPGDSSDQRIGLVLERSGFATWKLTEVRLPSFSGR